MAKENSILSAVENCTVDLDLIRDSLRICQDGIEDDINECTDGDADSYYFAFQNMRQYNSLMLMTLNNLSDTMEKLNQIVAAGYKAQHEAKQK